MSRLMRCSRVGGVILYSFDNGHFMAYTSPPPAVGASPQGEAFWRVHFPTITNRCAKAPQLLNAPPWHADFNRRGLAKPDRRGNIQGDGWRLRRFGHANFPCHGGLFTGPAFQFYSSSFHVTTQPSLILSWAPRKNRSPSSLLPFVPPRPTQKAPPDGRGFACGVKP